MIRRSFIALTAAAVLAGCSTAPITVGSSGSAVSIDSVTVTTDQLAEAVSGRNLAKDKSEVADDVRAALEARLIGQGPAGGIPGDLVVSLQKVNLVPPGASALAPIQSTITATVSVLAKDGSVLVEPVSVTAKNEGVRAGGIIGVAAAPSVEKDYERTVSGFANNLTKRLLGAPS